MLENWEQRSYREEPDVDRRPFCEHCKSIVLYGDDLTETPEGDWLCEECLELYQEEWGDNLKRLIWNAKMVAKRLHTWRIGQRRRGRSENCSIIFQSMMLHGIWKSNLK